MEYFTSIKIPAQDVVLYGLPVSAMVQNGMRVQKDGKVKGRLFHVPLYAGFSKDTALQSGYFFPFHITNAGEDMDFLKNGEQRYTGKFEDYNVLKVEPGQRWDILVDGQKIAVFDFSEAKFDEPKGESKMNVDFFDPGICGIAMTGHIGTLKKDDENVVVFDKALPVGTKLINLIAVASSDMTGPTDVSVGDGTTEEAYGKAESIAKGKTVVVDGGFKDIAAERVGLKPDSKLTAGSIDVYATVIRLKV